MKLWLMVALFLFSGCTGVDSGDKFHEALVWGDIPGLVVEIDYVPGFEPAPEVLQAIENKLHALTNKQVILMREATPIPRQASVIDREDLDDIHRATKTHGPKDDYKTEGWVYLHIIYSNGQIANNGDTTHVIGTTLKDEGAIFIFKEHYQHAYRVVLSQKLDAVADVERTVVLHELGHAMGLVNYGTPMAKDHDNDDHAKHSNNPASVMYPKLPLATYGLVFAPLPVDYDANDLADLAALRARD